MKINKKIAVALLMPLLMVPLYFWYQGFKAEARESYVRLTAEAIDFAEHSYHKEFKTFTSSLKDAGFSANPKDILIYTKLEDIPEADLKKIKQEDYPNFEVDTYRIILKWTNKDSGVESLWVLTESGHATKVTP